MDMSDTASVTLVSRCADDGEVVLVFSEEAVSHSPPGETSRLSSINMILFLMITVSSSNG